LISKKRGQSKIAIQRMVQEAMNYIDKTPSKETKVDLIQTLRTVTEGKVMYFYQKNLFNFRFLLKLKELD
jgi:26S proteasome regulatory subunit N5